MRLWIKLALLVITLGVIPTMATNRYAAYRRVKAQLDLPPATTIEEINRRQAEIAAM